MKALPTISLLRHHGKGTGAQCVSPLRAALRAIESSQVSCPSCQWPAAGRHFSVTSQHRDKDWEAQARALNQKGLDDQEAKYGRPARHDTDAFDADNQTKGLQTKTPWHRYGADVPPAERRGTNEPGKAMTKGKLLTTPSRLLKLILPLQNLDKSSSGVDIEPLALLVHPQQPLSYLERLIQSEIPAIKTADGKYKAPDIQFRAEDSGDDLVEQTKEKNRDGEEAEEEGTEAHVINGELVKTGKANSKGEEESIITHRAKLRGGPGQGGVESYSGEGHDATARDHRNFVRWSSSTEIGDFIRDAARGKEFAVLIEGADNEILVGVPSFHDRTYYLRLRLRKAAAQLDGLTKLKHECDNLAHRSAQRLAMGGFGGLVVWWALVYYLTFRTSLGWDAMEPVTYLAGLSTIMMGYLWFLYHNREVSYRAALNLTVSRRQNQLYEARGFDVHRWESLIEEANALRKEIKIIANEYDVDWDEKADTGSEEVVEELRKERRREKKRSKDDVDDDDVDPPPPKKEKD